MWKRNRSSEALLFLVLILYSQSIFIICRFCTSEFAYYSNLFVTPKSILAEFCDHSWMCSKAAKKSELWTCTFPAKAEQGDTPPSCSRSHEEITRGESVISNSGKLLNTSQLCLLFYKINKIQNLSG